jgi:hypothetical protein
MNNIETTFTITGAALAVVTGLATLYYFKRTDGEVPYHQKSISEISRKTKSETEKYQDMLNNHDRGTGKHKRSKKHKRSRKYKK